MFFSSIEFYVIAVIVAAAVIGLTARPASRGEARTWLLPASLKPATDPLPAPSITITCDDRYDLTIRRTGLGATESLSLCVTMIGHDISIEEHAAPALPGSGSGAMEAEVTLTFTGPTRYHLSYSAPAMSLFTAVQFTARPGTNIHKDLTLS